jgi:hypothetical protein
VEEAEELSETGQGKVVFGQDQLEGLLPPDLFYPGYRAEIAGFPAMDAAGHGEFRPRLLRRVPRPLPHDR